MSMTPANRTIFSVIAITFLLFLGTGIGRAAVIQADDLEAAIQADPFVAAIQADPLVAAIQADPLVAAIQANASCGDGSGDTGGSSSGGCTCGGPNACPEPP